MKPIYAVIAETLEKRRQSLESSLLLPDENALAAEFSVARETIRRALKVLETAGAITRKRGVGTFLHPLQIKSDGLRGKRVAVVPPWWAEKPDSWYTSVLYEGITQWAQAHDCQFTILHAERFPLHEHDWQERIRQSNVSGVLWIQPQEQQIRLVERTARLFPTVVLGRTLLGIGLHHVVPDYEKAALLLDDYLTSRGVSCYAMIEKNTFDPFTLRWIEAVRHAHAQRGAQFDAARLFFDYQCFQPDQLADLVLDYFLKAHPDVKGLVFPASGCLHWLQLDERFRHLVLNGMALVTTNYGPFPLEALFPGHTVTHIECDWARMASRAMDSLALLAEGKPTPEVLYDDVQLIEGNLGDSAGEATVSAS